MRNYKSTSNQKYINNHHISTNSFNFTVNLSKRRDIIRSIEIKENSQNAENKTHIKLEIIHYLTPDILIAVNYNKEAELKQENSTNKKFGKVISNNHSVNAHLISI